MNVRFFDFVGGVLVVRLGFFGVVVLSLFGEGGYFCVSSCLHWLLIFLIYTINNANNLVWSWSTFNLMYWNKQYTRLSTKPSTFSPFSFFPPCHYFSIFQAHPPSML